MTTSQARLTIGALARQAGVSAQTLRHYDRLGLLRPSATSAARYRLYTEADRARLELIRALRALDLDLDTIGRLLRGAVGVQKAAELHLRTLDHQMRTLERRRAVLRVLLASNAPATADRLARLQALAGFEQMERAQFLSDQLDRRLRGAGTERLQRWIRAAAVVDLPESPSEAQVEAWLELAEMVSDPTFLERHRRRSAGDGEQHASHWPTDLAALYRPAATAARAGIDPRSAKGRAIVRRWTHAFAERSGRRDRRAFAMDVLRGIDAQEDPREQRFWQLVAVLKPEVGSSAISVAWPWLVDGLRAWVGADASRRELGRSTSKTRRSLARRPS
jgi:DNA-binding transcriptional MerR regulator